MNQKQWPCWLILLTSVLGSGWPGRDMYAADEWDLVASDDFERSDLGDAWTVLNGRAVIRDGRLVLALEKENLEKAP